MLKIVKGYGCGFVPNYSVGEPVKIDNTVYIPGEDEETGEFISAEEQRRRAEEEKAAEEKRFNEEVEKRVSQIIAERSAEMERERAQLVEKGRSEAAEITAEAKAATMAVMEKAKRECAILKEQAKKEGHDEGFAEGREQSLEKYKKYIDASGKLLSEINSRKEAYYISNEEEMRETVFALVKKIVRTELRTNPKVLENIMAEAARNFRNSDYLKITLAEDAVTERFRTDEKLVKDLIPFISEIELELDKDAEEGTVIEDDGSQIVDAGIPTQLEFLQEIIKNTRGEADDEPFIPAASEAEPESADTLEASADKAEFEASAPIQAEVSKTEVPEEAEVPEPETDAPDFAEIMKAAAKAAETAEVTEAAPKTETEKEIPETLFDIADGGADKQPEKPVRKRKPKPKSGSAESAE